MTLNKIARLATIGNTSLIGSIFFSGAIFPRKGNLTGLFIVKFGRFS
jgi:hypothetical protein